MKKKTVKKLVCTTLLLSPLLITGCDTFGGQDYRTEPYGSQGHAHHRTAEASSVSSSASTVSRRGGNVSSSTSVPTEAPKAKHQAASNDADISHPKKAETPVVVTPPSTGMVAPTVQ